MIGARSIIASTDGVMLRSGRRPRLEAHTARVGACFETARCAGLLSMTTSVDVISAVPGDVA